MVRYRPSRPGATGATGVDVLALGVGLAVAVATALAVLSACASQSAPPPVAVRASRPVQNVLRGIDSLRAVPNLGRAVAMGESLLARCRTSDALPAWQCHDVQRLVDTLHHIAALPDSAQRTLAAVQRATAAVKGLVAADHPTRASDLVAWQLAVRRKHLGAEHVETAATLHALAERWMDQVNVPRADECESEALRIRTRVLGARHPDVAVSLRSLANIRKSDHPKDPEIDRLYAEALAIQREFPGVDDLEVAWTLSATANLYRSRGQIDRAVPLFEAAIAIRRREPAGDPDDLAGALSALATTHAAAAHWHDSERCLREALAIRRHIPGVRGDKMSFTLSMLGSALRAQGRNAQAESVLVEAAQIRELVWQKAGPGPTRARAYRLSNYWELAAAQLALDKPVDAWYAMELGTSRELVHALERLRPEPFPKDSIAARVVERVQATIPKGAVLIGWLEGRRGGGHAWEYPFWCYALEPTGPIHWVRCDAPPDEPLRSSHFELERCIRRLGHSAAWPYRVPESDDFKQMARSVYKLRLAPLEPWIANADLLLVDSPTFDHGLPIEVLVDSTGHYVGERFAVAYEPSALWYARRRSFGRRVSDPMAWRVLAVGDSATVRRRGKTLPALPRVGGEVRQVASLWPRHTILWGERATEGALRELQSRKALAEFNLVHIASHSFGDFDNPEKSALVLAVPAAAATAAAATASLPAEQGLLTALDIGDHWRLQADLVCLSGCETAMGRSRDTEGIEGLQSAMLCAGARCLLASAWPVDDLATSLLLRRFYNNLTGTGVPRLPMAAALRDAKMWVRTWRDPNGASPFAHPTYWAGFVLIGDPGEIRAAGR